MTSLPPLSHLQFAVLDCLGSEELTGRELRQRLKKRRIDKTGPAFYQLMSRIEESKLVDGCYDEKVVDGQMIRERRYRIRGEGARAREATLRFYTRAQSIGGVICPA